MTGGGKRLPVVGNGRRPESSPAFERIAVVGLGSTGGSLAMALRQAWPAALVIGVDSADVLEAAMRLHAVDVGADDLMIAGDADLVVLAGSSAESEAILARLGGAVTGSAVVTDVHGTKQIIASAVAGLPDRLAFVGGHPEVASPGAGIESARPDLFRDRPWFLTPVSASGEAVDRLRSLVRAVGGDPVVVPQGEHECRFDAAG